MGIIRNVVKGYKAEEFWLLNRLDNRTAGLVMVAKTQESFEQTRLELRQELWTKLYLAFGYPILGDDIYKPDKKTSA